MLGVLRKEEVKRGPLGFKMGPIRRWLAERETLIKRPKFFKDPPEELVGEAPKEKIGEPPEEKLRLDPKQEIRKVIQPKLQKAREEKLLLNFGYSYDKGKLRVDGEEFVVGQVGLSGFGETVKEEVEKLYGKLQYKVGGFREETWSNENVIYTTYASFGYLNVTVKPK